MGESSGTARYIRGNEHPHFSFLLFQEKLLKTHLLKCFILQGGVHTPLIVEDTTNICNGGDEEDFAE